MKTTQLRAREIEALAFTFLAEATADAGPGRRGLWSGFCVWLGARIAKLTSGRAPPAGQPSRLVTNDR
ncbi:MAG TPA: hypothetical protein VET46_07520 [Steroidobacteraceae bacterium]|nr:hypothetical protein [Steroidobacteraceae bacterium]